MIDKMTKYSFILLNSDKEDFLEELQGLGVIDITRSVKPVDEKSAALLDEISGYKKEISQIQKVSDPHLAQLAAARAELEQEYKAAAPWGDFTPEAIADLESKGLKLSFYCVSPKKFDPSWEQTWALQVINSDKDHIWFTLVNAVDFPVKEVPAPKCSASVLKARLAKAEQAIAEYKAELAARYVEIPELEARIKAVSKDLDRYLAGVEGEGAADNMLCCFRGFAPAECDEQVRKALESSAVYYFTEEATTEDNPPIKLKNNKFAKLFEPLTGMYGMPVYDEFDPTPVLSVFFMLFFAMCMGDAGYGLLLIPFGIAVEKKWINIEMFRNSGKLISFLGMATLIVGFFSGTFFGIQLAEAPWVPESLKKIMITGKFAGTNYDKMMVLSLVVGVFHICLAMVMKTICYIRRFGFRNCLSTIGWTLLIVGTVIVAALAIFALLPMNVAKVAVISIAAVSAIGIFILNKWGGNPLKNIGSGLWDTYNMATGLLGDVLSYVRLYALGLAGGMLGLAFNNIGCMVLGSDPTWQWIPAVVIFFIGHLLNILMSALGAFVHPLRLNFVEYFKNSGYEGKGLKYNPLK